MTAAAAPPSAAHVHEYPTFGLPSGSVRGFLSVLICSFFWIVLLLPAEKAVTAPLGHFFLLTLVFMAFASHPLQDARVHMLPWVMRLLFVGGSAVAVALAVFHSSHQAAARLTPNPNDVAQWPVLLGCLAGGFGVALFLRFVIGRRSELFMTLRVGRGDRDAAPAGGNDPPVRHRAGTDGEALPGGAEGVGGRADRHRRRVLRVAGVSSVSASVGVRKGRRPEPIRVPVFCLFSHPHSHSRCERSEHSHLPPRFASRLKLF